MAVENDSKTALYFMGLIFVGLAIGGIVGINQTKAYWTKFCTNRQDIKECQLMKTQPQVAIPKLISLGDKYGSHAAIPATLPEHAEEKSG
jgi:hypothetical protein